MVGPVTNSESRDFVSPVTGRLGVTKDPTSGDLEAPKNRIPSESAARTVYLRMRRNHIGRCLAAERIKGMLDGNPPYPARKMHAAGLADMTNINFKDGKAMFNSYALAYWSLFNDVENIIQFKLDFSNDNGQNEAWGKVLSEEWDRVIKLWPDFIRNTSFHQADLLRYGVNAWFWADEKDWRPVPIDFRDLLLPDQTENRADALSLIGIERTFTADELWGIYEKALKNPEGEWDAKSLGDVLYQLANISDERKNQINGIIELQKFITNNDVQYSDLYNDSIHLVTLLQKEYEGGITHCMIHRKIQTEKCIFFADRQYKSFSEAFMYYCLTPGAKYIHENKGIGHDIYSPVEGMTQLDCSVMDQAKRAGSLLIKSSATRGRDDRQIKFVHGGVIDIGEVDLAENSMGGNLPATVQSAQYFKQKVLMNNNLSGMDPGYPDKNISKQATQRQATREGRVQKNQIAFYYDQTDPFFREIVRKMLNASSGDEGFIYADSWKKRCIQRGVPKQVFDVLKEDLKPDGLPLYMEIYATRSSGSGSQVADQLEMQATMSIMPLLGERGRVNVVQDYIAAFRGFRYVNRYYPPADQNREPTAEDSVASVENNQLGQGYQVIVSPDSNHYIHATVHARGMKDWMEHYQKNGNGNIPLLLQTNDAFAAYGPHFTKHLMYLSQDPTRKAQMEQLRAQWAVLSNFGDMVKNNALQAEQAQQRQQQGAQQQMDKNQVELQVGMDKNQKDAAIKSDKLAADIERDRTRDQNKFLLASQAQADTHRVDIIHTTNKLAIEAQKELADESPGDLPQ